MSRLIDTLLRAKPDPAIYAALKARPFRASGCAVDDLHALSLLTPNEHEQARINALIGAVRARQRQMGFIFDSSFTPALMTVLERERQRQQRGASA